MADLPLPASLHGRVVLPPVFMEEPTRDLRVPIFLARPRRGFKNLPVASTATFSRPSQPFTQRLSPLSSVTNAEDLDEEGNEKDKPWGVEESPRPLAVKWREVCATSIFPVLSEAPRRWDGSRQTMPEFLAFLAARDRADDGGEGDDGWWEIGGELKEQDPKLQKFKTQLENIAKAHGLDHSRFVDWMTDPTSGSRSYTADPPSPSAQATTNGTSPSNKKLELLSNLVTELDSLSRDHGAPAGYFFSDITRIKWRLEHLDAVADSASLAQALESESDDENSQPTPDRVEILTRAVINLAALVDPLAPPNPATTLMAEVVDAYLDAHYTYVWVDAEDNIYELEELRETHFNTPGHESGRFEDGFRGEEWRVIGDHATARAAATATAMAAAVASGSTDPLVERIGEEEDEAIW